MDFLEEKKINFWKRIRNVEEKFQSDQPLKQSDEALLRNLIEIWNEENFSIDLNERVLVARCNGEGSFLLDMKIFYHEPLDCLRFVERNRLPGCPKDSWDQLILSGHEDIIKHLEECEIL